jgi:hypothetical protein
MTAPLQFSREDLTSAVLRLFAVWLVVDVCATVPARLASWYVWSVAENLGVAPLAITSLAALLAKSVAAALLWALSRPVAWRIWQGASRSAPIFDLPGAQPLSALLVACFGFYLLLTAIPETTLIASVLYRRGTTAPLSDVHSFGLHARIIATLLQLALGSFLAAAAKPVARRLVSPAPAPLAA